MNCYRECELFLSPIFLKPEGIFVINERSCLASFVCLSVCFSLKLLKSILLSLLFCFHHVIAAVDATVTVFFLSLHVTSCHHCCCSRCPYCFCHCKSSSCHHCCCGRRHCRCCFCHCISILFHHCCCNRRYCCCCFCHSISA